MHRFHAYIPGSISRKALLQIVYVDEKFGKQESWNVYQIVELMNH